MNDYERRVAAAEPVCVKWLKKAPVFRGSEDELLARARQETTHMSGMSPRAEMLEPWVEEFASFNTECARSVAIGGRFPDKGRFSFEASVPQADMKRLLKIPYAKALRKRNTNGDFYEDFAGSVFRKERSGRFIVVVWTFERLGNWG